MTEHSHSLLIYYFSYCYRLFCLVISLFKLWYFSIFSLYAFLESLYYLVLQHYWTTMQDLSPLFMIKTMSGLLALMTQSHWTLIFHSVSTSQLAVTPWGICSYHLSSVARSYFSHSFQCMIFLTLSWLVLHSFCASLCTHWQCCLLFLLSSHTLSLHRAESAEFST